ncbi:MAG: hypothetical protein KGZ88_13000 [Methylomicrobium sp.]|nr:hypothetical protein [Methylomicrobium sp.]
MANWACLIPLFPLIAAVMIGLGCFSGLLPSLASERITAKLAVWSLSLSCLLALGLLTAFLPGYQTHEHAQFVWLQSGDLQLPLRVTVNSLNLVLAGLFSIIFVIVARFSVNYMHKERGFHRFFSILCLFAAAMFLLVLSGSALSAFMGWEIAGICSFLLIAYAYDRPVAANNAARAFITNRVGDAGFLMGIGLSLHWIGSANWQDINEGAADLLGNDAVILALCFSVAAFAKSAQIPFSPWLSRAMEGPTPSSAVFYGAIMIHAGVIVILTLQPLFEAAPLAMGVIAVVGLLTAFYGWFSGLTQTDIKSSLVFSVQAQIGLMFLECGLGFWQLAAWHLGAHTLVRSYQFLTAPSILHNAHDNPVRTVPSFLAVRPGLFAAAQQRLWLEPAIEWVVVKPVRRLARDLSFFEIRFVDPLLGSPAPAIRAISTLTQIEERKIGARLDNDEDRFATGSGLAGKLTEWSAGLVNWFEYHFVLRGVGKESIKYGRKLGKSANKLEQILQMPRYLVIFVLISLLIAS